jgi:phosphoribosylformimino-5-aminoimidazole carboxamide ribotide isomerase
VRDASLLGLGVARVVVGSLAVEDPGAVQALARAYPGRVAVGLDHRAGQVRVRGWEEGAGVSVADVLAAVDCPELGAVVVTEIERDGTLSGPDLGGLAEVLAVSERPVIASGGVSSVVDLRALAALRHGERRLAGVIVGKAIYEGRIDLESGLRAVV